MFKDCGYLNRKKGVNKTIWIQVTFKLKESLDSVSTMTTTSRLINVYTVLVLGLLSSNFPTDKGRLVLQHKSILLGY